LLKTNQKLVENSVMVAIE